MSNYINATIKGTNKSIQVKTHPQLFGFTPQPIVYFSCTKCTKNTSPTATTIYSEINNLNSQNILTAWADKEPDQVNPKWYSSIIRDASSTTTEFIETKLINFNRQPEPDDRKVHNQEMKDDGEDDDEDDVGEDFRSHKTTPYKPRGVSPPVDSDFEVLHAHGPGRHDSTRKITSQRHNYVNMGGKRKSARRGKSARRRKSARR